MTQILDNHNIPRRLIRGGVATILSFGALAACGATTESSRSNTPTDTQQIQSEDDLTFQHQPDQFTVGYCQENPNTSAVYIDSELEEPRETGDFTVGLANVDENGRPIMVLGATVREIGSYTYLLATSNNPDTAVPVDLSTGTYSEVLQGPDNQYDAIFSAHSSEDGRAYFTVNCLPQFEFDGSQRTPSLPPLGELFPNAETF